MYKSVGLPTLKHTDTHHRCAMLRCRSLYQTHSPESHEALEEDRGQCWMFLPKTSNLQAASQTRPHSLAAMVFPAPLSYPCLSCQSGFMCCPCLPISHSKAIEQRLERACHMCKGPWHTRDKQRGWDKQRAVGGGGMVRGLCLPGGYSGMVVSVSY